MAYVSIVRPNSIYNKQPTTTTPTTDAPRNNLASNLSSNLSATTATTIIGSHNENV